MSARAPGVWGRDPEALPLATTVDAVLVVERADLGELLDLDAGVIWSRETRLESSPEKWRRPILKVLVAGT
jgi:hypothetical protein